MKSKYIVLISTSTIIMCVLIWALLWLNSTAWYRPIDAKITVNNLIVNNVRIYRTKDNAFLIVIKHKSSITESYIIPPHHRYVSSADINMFKFVFGCAYSKEPYWGVPLDGTEAKADNFNAQLSIHLNSLKFITLSGKHIRVIW